MSKPLLAASLGFAVALLPIGAAAQTASRDGAQRVVVTAASATAYSCAQTTCRVVGELEKGAVVAVLKTDGDWHQVMVRTASNATTGWVKSTQVAATSERTTRMTSTERSDGIFRPAATPEAAEADAEAGADARGCLTCLATREPSPDEWNAAMADAATKKAAPGAGRVGTGLADGRTSEERMRDMAEQRYAPELKRLSGMASAVDADLQAYLASCFQRFASIPVEGAAPRATAVDDILKTARSRPGAARFALWSGTAAFAWNPAWAPQSTGNSSLPSCERLWEDARGRADRLKVDIEYLERDARDHDVFPGIVREMLAAHGLAEGPATTPVPPVTDIR